MCYIYNGDIMKNKGFTIVELLAVIIILGVVMFIATPNIIKILNDSKKSLGEEQKRAIERAARSWGVENLYIKYDNNNNPFASQDWVDIDTLIRDGYLKSKTFKTLESNEDIESGVCIFFDSNQFSYNYAEINKNDTSKTRKAKIEEECKKFNEGKEKIDSNLTDAAQDSSENDGSGLTGDNSEIIEG